MDADCIGDLGGRDDGGHVEITLGGRGWADADSLVCEQNVLEIVVRSGVHRDCLDTHLAARTQYAQGNLAAIGYNDFFEHTAGSG